MKGHSSQPRLSAGQIGIQATGSGSAAGSEHGIEIIMNTRYIAAVNENEYVIELIDDHSVIINGVKHEIDFQNLRQPLSYSLLVDGGSYEVNIFQENGGWEVLLRGKRYSIRVEDEREKRLKKYSRQWKLNLIEKDNPEWNDLYDNIISGYYPAGTSSPQAGV